MLVFQANICRLIFTEPKPNHIPSPTIRLAAISLPAENRPVRVADGLRRALLISKISANAGVFSTDLGGATASSTRSNIGRTTNLGASMATLGAIDASDLTGAMGVRWQMKSAVAAFASGNPQGSKAAGAASDR